MQLADRLYEADTAAWAQTSANSLREHRFAELEFVKRAHSKARRLAAIETSLDISVFPEHCQYGTDQLHADWLPS